MRNDAHNQRQRLKWWNMNFSVFSSGVALMASLTAAIPARAVAPCGDTEYSPVGAAPLYWSMYEYPFTHQNAQGNADMPPSEWTNNVNWVQNNLKASGYTMVCTDGWGDENSFNQNGYRTTYSNSWANAGMSFASVAQALGQQGMTLGIYENPLWVNAQAVAKGCKIAGTNIPLSSIYNSGDGGTFNWCQVEQPGAKQYVQGYVDYYAGIGVKYLRVDFLSWYDTGCGRHATRMGSS
jgi:hypothetical protein